MSLKFCSRCLYSSDHPLGIVINENGLCSGCLIHEEKDTLNWAHRWDKLKKHCLYGIPVRTKNKGILHVL